MMQVYVWCNKCKKEVPPDTRFEEPKYEDGQTIMNCKGWFCSLCGQKIQ